MAHVLPVFQRIDQAGFKLPLDEQVLADADTLLVFGLDHMVTGQEAAPEEIEALRQFLTREGTCLILGPHRGRSFGGSAYATWSTITTATRWCPASNASDSTRGP